LRIDRIMVISLWPRFLAHPVYTNILSHLLTYWQTITTIIPMQKTPRINVNLYTWIRKKRRRRSILGVCTPVPRQHAGIGRVTIDIFFCAQVENRNIVASNSLSGFGLCLFVCLFVRTSLGKQVPYLHQIFCLYYPRPWFGPRLYMAAARYVMHFLFCGWRHVYTWRPGMSDAKKGLPVGNTNLISWHIVKLTHQGQYLTGGEVWCLGVPWWTRTQLGGLDYRYW